MLERLSAGAFPRKHHIQFRDAAGGLLWEECITQLGFDGPYTLAYHQRAPHRQRIAEVRNGWTLPVAASADKPLAKRHFLTPKLPALRGPSVDVRVPLLFNDDVTVGFAAPTEADPTYFVDADADELVFVQEGSGTLRTQLGDLRYAAQDYVGIPRGLLHRWIPDEGVAQKWLVMECHGGMRIPKQWRTETGQLRMDAPYCHRDFKPVAFRGPLDEGLRGLLVKKNGAFHAFTYAESPLDVVGWDGSVYPFVFPILNFQPRAGLVHLPPDWHGTFAARGALICSFVPRMVDFHPEAIPCPYPHSSVDCDEILFYVSGNFTSRRGVGPGSVSFHPAGIPHGPHPGAYEASIGHKATNELAVMMDTLKPLRMTAAAFNVEDPGYQDSFIP
jgi:homogentisate 1,2-dioxygenase